VVLLQLIVFIRRKSCVDAYARREGVRCSSYFLAPKARTARPTGDVLLSATALSEKIIWITIPTTNRAEDVNYGYSLRFDKL